MRAGPRCRLIFAVVASMSMLAMAAFSPEVQSSPGLNSVVSASGASIPPGRQASPPGQSPTVWTGGGDFVVSCDDGNDSALDPEIAVAPPGSPTANSLHAVWHEYEESLGVTAIHYSMSKASEKGLKWSNDEPAEGDRTINGIFNGQNATNASVAVDVQGYVHVVWCQQFNPGVATYEAFYKRSMDNGQSWGPDVRISYRKNGGLDAHQPFAPKMAVSNDYLGQKILHVVWAETDPQTTHSEVYYSRSYDNGNTWSGASDDALISGTNSAEPAYDPDVSVGGSSDLVHVVWSQFNPSSASSEVFYTRSTNAGAGTWAAEDPVSYSPTTPDDRNVGRAKVASVGSSVLTIWDQPIPTSGQYGEICISMSTNAGGAGTWNGANSDIPISFHDPNGTWGVDFGSLDVVAGLGGAAYAVWTEFDEHSPFGSSEICYSMSHTPADPLSWTGRSKDNVLSFPDGAAGEPASANKPSADLASFGGKTRLQVVWSEPNDGVSGKGAASPVAQSSGSNLAQGGNEIHYIPETTFDVPIAGAGWNFISVPLVQNDTSLAAVLDDYWGDGGTAWDRAIWWDPNSPGDRWKQYNTAWPAGMNDLAGVNHKMGLWVNVTAVGDGYLTVAGNFTNSTQISLKTGWNLIGYPARNDTSYSVASLKAATGATIVEGYDANATYKTGALLNSYVLKKGRAYWVRVPSDTTWTVDW